MEGMRQAETNTAPADGVLASGGGKTAIALVRGPLVSSMRAMNNEATPAVGLAHIAGYLEKFGYRPVIVDGIGEALNDVWPLKDYDNHNCQGLTFGEIVKRIPAETKIIGVSAMFSGEWPVQRDLIA